MPSHAYLLQPDYSIPDLPASIVPSEDAEGKWDSADVCQGKYGTPPTHPATPYGPENSNSDPAALVEDGFKRVRGYLTEGRYLTFEMNGFALSIAAVHAGSIGASPATATHSDISQSWVVHATGGTALEGGGGAGTFLIASAIDGRYISAQTSLTTSPAGAESYTIEDLTDGKGYSLKKQNGDFVIIGENGTLATSTKPKGFQVFSVTYKS